MFHFKAPGRRLQQDFLAVEWGEFSSYVEVGDDQYAIRQVELFDNGNVLRYDREHWCDDYAMMAALKFSRKPKWSVYFLGAELINPPEFEKVWRIAERSELWAQQVKRSRVKQWGAFRAG